MGDRQTDRQRETERDLKDCLFANEKKRNPKHDDDALLMMNAFKSYSVAELSKIIIHLWI